MTALHDAPRHSQTAAFYVLYIICSIWQSDSSLSRYTVVYFLPGNVFYCYILKKKFCNYFFNNLADIKVLRELNKGIFGKCGNVSLANKWVRNITGLYQLFITVTIPFHVISGKNCAALVLILYVFEVIVKVKTVNI